MAGCDPLVEVSVFSSVVEDGAYQVAEGDALPVMVWVSGLDEDPVWVTVSVEGERVESLVVKEAGSRVSVSGLVEPGEPAFEAFEAVPEDGSVSVSVQAEGMGLASGVLNAACGGAWTFEESLSTVSVPVGERAQAGLGAHVITAGVWENGTSFYTNHERFHERSDLPRGDVDEEVDLDPLRVYVYEEDAQERGAQYEREGYVPTIEGFNENLKGHPTVGASVTWMPPEEAYTRAGNEDHDLYGDALIFFVEVVEVREVACDVPEPVCVVPEADEPLAT